ncbi:hypothetical protein ABZ754_16190 [Micromonospora purpureochromogenes]|uniref:hypothetical protein n=1 Tax=Micromonospora purpureochromogenes TaxID=47872 RepID=UPI0033D4593A
MLIAAPVTAALVAGGLTAPAAAAAPTPRITFSAISFSPDHIDTTGGPYVVNANWTVADTSTTATQVTGTTWLQQFTGATAVGPELPVRFTLTPDGTAQVSANNGGTVRSSSYSYEFVVPQYGPSASATWRITRITAQDDQGTTGSISGKALAKYDPHVAVTQLADSSAPDLESFGRAIGQQDAVYDDGSGVTLRYSTSISDQTGFWKGSFVLAGPGGARITAPIELRDSGAYPLYCGTDSQIYDVAWIWCDGLEAKVPAGSPSGTWTVEKVVVTDRAGNTREVTDVPASPIRVSRNDVLSAGDFTLDPAQVDNWREERPVTLRLKPAGVVGELVSIAPYTDRCWGATTEPTMGADGTASVTLRMPSHIDRCTVTGIVLTDSAGNVAVYGSAYGGSVLDLVVTRVPDTTAPVISAARLSQTTASAGSVPYAIGVYVTVDDTSGAPVAGMSTTMYDAEGRSVSGSYGGASPLPTGEYNATIGTEGLAPGTYTVGVTLTDAAGNSTLIGYPNGAGDPAPNGPLVFTVTS